MTAGGMGARPGRSSGHDRLARELQVREYGSGEKWREEQAGATRRFVTTRNAASDNEPGCPGEPTDDALKAGAGPTLLEDFHFREKLTHF